MHVKINIPEGGQLAVSICYSMYILFELKQGNDYDPESIFQHLLCVSTPYRFHFHYNSYKIKLKSKAISIEFSAGNFTIRSSMHDNDGGAEPASMKNGPIDLIPHTHSIEQTHSNGARFDVS